MRLRAALTALLAAVAVMAGAGAASADDVDGLTLRRLSVNTMCVHPDFAATGSGWKVQAAVAEWNAAQSLVRLTMANEAGCAVVYVHRYSAVDDRCGYTTWDRTWSQGRWSTGGVWLVDGADIYLNELCKPLGQGRAVWSRWIVAHEIGHALGLSHNPSSRSVMRVPTEYVTSPRTIGRVDVWNLAALYRR